MERLTMKTKSTDGVVNLTATDETCIDICANMDGDCNRRCPINEAYKRLAAYEDLGTVEELAALKQAESEGLSVKLPVSMQSIVYCIETGEITTVLICGADVDMTGEITIYGIDDSDPINGVEYTFKWSDFGKKVFRDKAAALAAMGGRK